MSKLGLQAICLALAIFVGLGMPVLAQGYQYQGGKLLIEGGDYTITAKDVDTFTQIKRLPSQQWQSFKVKTQRFGLNGKRLWRRFALNNPNEHAQRLQLSVDYPLLDNLDIYLVDARHQVVEHWQLGDMQPFSARPVLTQSFVVPVHLQAGTNYFVYVGAQTEGALIVPILLQDETSFVTSEIEKGRHAGMIFGFLMAMVLVNAIMAMVTRSIYFFWYALNLLSAVMIIFTLNGLAFQLLWSDSIWLQQHAVAIFGNLTLVLACLFSRHVLDLHLAKAWQQRIIKVVLFSSTLAMLAALVLPVQLGINLMVINVSAGLLSLVVLGASRWQYSISAKLYTVAWILLFMPVLFAAVISLGMVVSDYSFSQLLTLGISFDAIVFSVLMAIRFANERRDKVLAQQQMLIKAEEVQKAQQQNLELQQQVQEELESHVSERTFELEITLRELAEKNEELEQLTSTDPLTGTRNRRYFDKRLQSEFKRSARDHTPLSLIMLDVDHFKAINDEHGHLVGDDALKFVAQLINQQLKRAADTVSRYGGEEFAVLLPNTPESGAVALAANIVKILAQTPCPLANTTLPMTISAGISSLYCDKISRPETLIDQADTALYQAKENGRNQYKVFASNIDATDNNAKDDSL